MEQTRRFVFRGNASAYGGQIYRYLGQKKKLEPVILVSGATSSVTVVGGQSKGRSRSADFLDGFVQVGSAGTDITAGFDNAEQAYAMSEGAVLQQSLTATTTVGAWVKDLVLGKGPKRLKGEQPPGRGKFPRLSIGWIGGSLSSSSGKPGDEMPIKLGADTDAKQIFIDGYQLGITWNKVEFAECDTMTKLQTAANDPDFIKRTNDCMFRTAAKAGPAASGSQTSRPAPLLYGTVVKELKWVGEEHPTAKIDKHDHHSIHVPDFGTVYFGEILVTAESRRVTMLRVHFGSPTGGDFACSEYETNGSWVPPF